MVLAFLLWPLAWYLLFFLPSSAYLVHNNSFGVNARSVFEPYISMIVAWSVAVSFPVLSAIGDDFIGVVGAALGFLGAGAVSLVAIYQIRRSDLSLRTGPWSGPSADQLPPTVAVGLSGLGRLIHLGFAAFYLLFLSVLLLFLAVNVILPSVVEAYLVRPQ
ncbi:MAG: hypothetical protein GY773_04000 [Actinomycetia bacterium]|nr:hypothetical protein [Actinomycetes bacterium]